jgi:hypothetical protein
MRLTALSTVRAAELPPELKPFVTPGGKKLKPLRKFFGVENTMVFPLPQNPAHVPAFLAAFDQIDPPWIRTRESETIQHVTDEALLQKYKKALEESPPPSTLHTGSSVIAATVIDGRLILGAWSAYIGNLVSVYDAGPIATAQPRRFDESSFAA